MTRGRIRAFAGAIVILAVIAAFAIPFLRGEIRWLGLDAQGNEIRNNLLAVYSELTATWVPTADLEPMPHTDVNPYGINVFFEQEVEEAKIRRSLDMIKAAGFHFVKQEVLWYDIEQPAKGLYYDTKNNVPDTWAKYDRIVNLCEEYDLELIMRLDTSPEWARPSNPTKLQTPPDNYEDYGDFVSNIVSRYRGKVKYYQIWNEPNWSYEWGDRPVNAADYTRLLKTAYMHAKEADPGCVILAASLAATLDEHALAYNDLKYLQQMYDAGAREYFDIATINPYGLRSGPYDRRLQFEDINFSHPIKVRQVMIQNGDARKPLWASEMGWCALPGDFPDEPLFGRVTRDQQARYTVQALQRAQREWPWMGVTNIWHFRMVHDVNMSQQIYYFGIVGNDFAPFPVYWAIKDVAGSTPVVEYGYRQETHWALSYSGNWTEQRNERASIGRLKHSSTPGDSVSFLFRGTNLDLVITRGPSAGGIDVSIDGLPANRLEQRGDVGHIDCYADEEEFQYRVPVAAGLDDGLHRAVLTVSGHVNSRSVGHDVAIDGIIVDRQVPSLRARVATWTALVVGALVVLAILGYVGRKWWLRAQR